jgi:hypothetical protein
MTMDYFVLDDTQSTTVLELDADDHVEILPILIDGADPGSAVNLNPNAVDYALNASVSLTGKHVAPQRIVDDGTYQEHCPDLIDYLWTLPICELESDRIFAPPANEEGQDATAP